MSDYLQILAQEDFLAQSGYDENARDLLVEPNEYEEDIDKHEGHTHDAHELTEEEAAAHQKLPISGHAEAALQSNVAPSRVEKAKYIVVDGKLRDWKLNPNPYNFSFGFGKQTEFKTYDLPVYENNPFVPTFDTRTQLVSLCNNTQVYPNRGGYIAKNQEGKEYVQSLPAGYKPDYKLPNKNGWYSPDAQGFLTVFHPPYDPMNPLGNPTGDTSAYRLEVPKFGTVDKLENVKSIALVKAVIASRSFNSIQDPSYLDSETHLTNFNGSIYSFPYLVMKIRNAEGRYYGASENLQGSFSTLSVKYRTPNMDMRQFKTGSQFLEYEPWDKEAYEFPSIKTVMDPLDIQVTTTTGDLPKQNDNLTITSVYALPSSSTDPTSPAFKLVFRTNRHFSPSEIRIGDRISFYQSDLKAIEQHPSSTNIFKTQPQAYFLTKVLPQLFSRFLFVFDLLNLDSPEPPWDQLDHFDAFTLGDPRAHNSDFAQIQGGSVTEHPWGYDALNHFQSPGFDLTTYGISPSILNINTQPSYVFKAITLDADREQVPTQIPR